MQSRVFIACASGAAILIFIVGVLEAVAGSWPQAVLSFIVVIFVAVTMQVYRGALRRDQLVDLGSYPQSRTSDLDGSLVLTRQRAGRRDTRRPYRVMVDDVMVGTVRDQEVQTFFVSPGEHTIWLKLDWTTSKRVRVFVGEREQVGLVCRPGGGDLRTGFDAILKYHNYMKLELLQNQNQSQ